MSREVKASGITAATAVKLSASNGPSAVGEALSVIEQRIHKAASSGSRTLNYIFDGVSGSGHETRGPLGQTMLSSGQIKAIVSLLEARGFKYEYIASQDPGHICDRPLNRLSW